MAIILSLDHRRISFDPPHFMPYNLRLLFLLRIRQHRQIPNLHLDHLVGHQLLRNHLRIKIFRLNLRKRPRIKLPIHHFGLQIHLHFGNFNHHLRRHPPFSQRKKIPGPLPLHRINLLSFPYFRSNPLLIYPKVGSSG